MERISREKWPLGWTPASDNTNGDPSGLIRMDNLRLDDIGALTLNRGMVNINATPFPGFPHSPYSRQINNVKHRFVGISTGDVLHAPDGVNFSDTILTPGNPARARFSSVLGNIFISSGAKKVKFDGERTWNWGIETPKSPVGVVVKNQDSFPVDAADGEGNYSNWVLVEGLNFNNNRPLVEADSTEDTLRVSYGALYEPSKDFTAFPNGGSSTDDDTFSFYIKVGDTANLVKIRVEFMLSTDGSLEEATDYFWKEWNHDIDNTEFVEGINTWSLLTSQRRFFVRQGTNNDLGWNTVGAVRVTFLFTAITPACVATELKWSGSTEGPLTGQVEYAQINVRDNGVYVAKSGVGPLASQMVSVFNGKTEILFASSGDEQITERWLFRRSNTLTTFLRIGVLKHESNGGYTYTDSSGTAQGLSGTGSIFDTCPDSAAQLLDITLDLNVVSVADISDEFFSIIEGAYFERIVIATQGEILLGDPLNPDGIDNAHRLRVSGDKTESILWITRLSAEILLVGTTKNLYELFGNLVNLPDGTINVQIRALGEAHPPLGLEFALDSSNVIYCAADGWRRTSGAASELISPQLNHLFRGTERYGVAPVQVLTNALTVYPVVIYKGQVVTSNPLQDGTRTLFIYDLLLQYWRLWYHNPISLFTEEDGTLIAGFGSPGDYYLRVLDTGSTVNNTGSPEEGQKINFLTVYDANNQPRNRKDAFTLQLQMDTGGKDVEVHISMDAGGYERVGFYRSSVLTDFSINIFDINSPDFSVAFRYSIWITSNNDIQTFRLTKLIIEYEPRPEQLTQLRLMPNNLGTFSRKRFTNYAFVIDTLGNTCTFTPNIDNTTFPALVQSFGFYGKKTFVFYFRSDVIGTDIGGIINATGRENSYYPGVFEFYTVDLKEIVSEKLPVPVKFLVIPATDYGNPNRKRHSSYKFQIDCRGSDVRFIPILDGVSKTAATINTTGKRTAEYFFNSDTIAIDIGGTLETLNDTPFEFYGVVISQHLEVLPPRLLEFRIPENNYGIAARKRTRTMPMEINTNGSPVTFIPIVDNISGTPTTLNTPNRQTAFHYFNTDVFGIDYSGELIGTSPFEFYGLLKPEDVEVLPVAKLFDQVGPVHFERIGKIIGFRIRIITGSVALPWIIYGEDSVIATGVINTVPGVDAVYEQEWITKGRNATITRMEIGPAVLPFHRYYVTFKINLGGEQNAIKTMKVQ